MGKLIAGIIIGGLGVYAWQRTHQPEITAPVDDQALLQEQAPRRTAESLPVVEADSSRFHCDGRVYCSQMTSCEEATYFLEHCPGVKMDGGGDGVPCEKQWCGSR